MKALEQKHTLHPPAAHPSPPRVTALGEIQANLILLRSASLHFTDVVFFLKHGRQDTPPAKTWRPTLLQYLLYCGGLRPNPQYLQGIPVN